MVTSGAVFAVPSGAQSPGERFDRLAKRHVRGRHEQVNGVEVHAAAEAPGEVFARVDCRVEISAAWTEEPQVTVPVLPRQIQLDDDLLDGNVIS